MPEALVSIIIPTFNRETFLGDALESIIAQTYQEWECLVIDDGSTDGTDKLLEDFCLKDSRIRYFRRPGDYGKGANACRNYGFSLCKGAYVAFCDDDDFWLPSKLEKQILAFGYDSTIGVVTSDLEYVESDGIRTGRVIDFTGCNGYLFEDMLFKNRTSMITTVVKREVFDTVGLFDVSFRFSEDWEFWRRVSYYFKFYCVPEVLACVRKHGTNTTNELSGSAKEQFVTYRRLTKSLNAWGRDRFSKRDFELIARIEWDRYKNLLTNHCPGINGKLLFFFDLLIYNPLEALRFFGLFLKYELLK